MIYFSVAYALGVVKTNSSNVVWRFIFVFLPNFGLSCVWYRVANMAALWSLQRAASGPLANANSAIMNTTRLANGFKMFILNRQCMHYVWMLFFPLSATDLWNSRITATLTMLSTSWMGRSCAESGWSSNMPAGLGETEMATVGVTGVVGAVSAVYYKMPSLPLPLGVRCPCGLHTVLLFQIVSEVWSQGPWSACSYPKLRCIGATRVLCFSTSQVTENVLYTFISVKTEQLWDDVTNQDWS